MQDGRRTHESLVVKIHKGVILASNDWHLRWMKSRNSVIQFMMTSQVEWGARLKCELMRRKIQGFCPHLKIVGGGHELFHLLAGEDVSGSEVALSVTVLASLGGGDLDDLLTWKGRQQHLVRNRGIKTCWSVERKTLTAQSTGTFDGMTYASTFKAADCNAE